MKSFDEMVIKKGKKYFQRFYPLLLENNLFLENKYRILLDASCLDKNSYILDLGCGTGIHLSLLKSYCRIVVGVDKSYILAKEAKDVLGDREKVKIIVAEAERMPLRQKMFDLVFLNDSLIHFENQEEALKQIKSVLKKDGKLIFIEPNIINPLIMLTLLFFKDGLRIFRRNRARTRKLISKYFSLEKEEPLNLIYTKDKIKIFLVNLFDKITSFAFLSSFSFRYVIIARNETN